MAAYSSTIAVTLRSTGECRRRIRSMWARRHLPLRVSWLKAASAPFGRGSGPQLASFRAGTLLQPHGLPPVDPELLLIRMLVIGHCCSIRSERRPWQEVKRNLAYRWFCSLDDTGASQNDVRL